MKKSYYHQFNRRSIRLSGYDYAQEGMYFVTICTYNRGYLFGDVVRDQIRLNDIGQMIQNTWHQLSNRFPNIQLDKFVVMPNHVHGIISIVGADLCVRPELCDHPNFDNGQKCNDGQTRGSAPTLGRVIQWFKTMTTNYYIRGVRKGIWMPFDCKLWQRNYYERIIRNEQELNRIRQYILDNPSQWETDPDNISPG